MEQNLISELEDELNQIDTESIKLDAIIHLKTWQKKMYALIDKTYKNRLNEIDAITATIDREVKEKQDQIQNLQKNDQHGFEELKHEIEALKSNLIIHDSIPENFSKRIERTILISYNEDGELVEDDMEEEDDDDEPVIVDIDRNETRIGDRVVMVVTPQQPTTTNREGTVSKFLNSQPIQNAIALHLVRALANVGTIAATSTTTAAATTMAKTAIIATACGVGTVAYGVGKIAIVTTKKAWSLMFSSDE